MLSWGGRRDEVDFDFQWHTIKTQGTAIIPAGECNLDYNFLHPWAVVPQQCSSLCLRFCSTESHCAHRRDEKAIRYFIEVNENLVLQGTVEMIPPDFVQNTELHLAHLLDIH